MADLEKEVEAMIYAGLGDGEQDANATSNPQPRADIPPEQEPETGERRVIDLDLYRFPNGAVLLVPGGAANPLDTNAVESDPPPQDTAAPLQATPLEETAAPEQEEDEPARNETPTVPLAHRRSWGKAASLLVPLVLLLLLSAGAASYLFLLPLTATATITIMPDTKTLHTQTTLTIAASPKGSQMQGRELAPSSLTESKTVPATGHAHQDATRATGVITFYNAASTPLSIPAGVSFTASTGTTIVTTAPVTVQAAVRPLFGVANVPAQAIETGAIGNIPANAINTQCCGSVFVTATNNVPFSGGQAARDYSSVQASDIQGTATDMSGSLTPKVTAALTSQAHTGESLVPPLCTPHTTSSVASGEEAASVTVSVTQSCKSVAYTLDSLEQVATTFLAHTANLDSYQQIGTVQVTINGSTYTKTAAQLQVSLTGVWVYHFSPGKLTHLTRLIAGETLENATHQLEQEPGIEQVSIHLSRLDFRNELPTDPTHIHMVFFVIAQ
jgi:hypothetical protein